jgi:3-dehydroquinate synthase
VNGDEISLIVGEKTIPHMVDEVDKYSHVVMMVSKTVEELFAEAIPKLKSIRGELTKITLNDGEALKSIRNYQKIMRVLIERGIPKDSLLVYIGGGTVGDIAGFVASTYKRGIDLMAIPTTLLSQADSCLGGKNGINFSGVKNAIGTFYNPKEIIVDLDFVRTSPPDTIRDGLGEIIKHSIIGDRTMLNLLENANDLESLQKSEQLQKLISLSLKLKADRVSRDFRETHGERRDLNFGHTIAHAIESVSKNEIHHGIAVATGMLVELYMGETMGITDRSIRSSLTVLMNKYSIPRIQLRSLGLDSLVSFIRNDKKASDGKIAMRIPADFGVMTDISIDQEAIRSHIRSYMDSNESVARTGL